jgi:phenylacetate-coenzyme A ligase PaaK-like adenylate-forming protein
MLADMEPVRACANCERRLQEASAAIRRHSSLMETGIKQSRTDHTEEERQAYRARLEATFNDAQAAWDAYREHLIEHGIIPSAWSQLRG